jgi:murein DD-endopeptidase MepM/ murein hydrolase activator NlpD
MINPRVPRLLRIPAELRWPTVNSGCAHTDPLARITITRSAIRHLARARDRPWWCLSRSSPSRRLLSRRRRRRALLAILTCALLAFTAAITATTASASAPDAAASPSGPTARFSWPLAPPHPVLRRFEPPATPYGPGHRGVDLGGSVGEAVFAAGDGLVLYAGSLFNCGLISIEHPGGLRTTYTPVVPSVHVAQEVARRQQIGTLLAAQPGCPEEVGNDGTGPPVFLYWGVHQDRDYLDPLRLVETGEIRLLPWPGDGQ